jgi:cytochrome o ubiquinol oxidase operon protein cyoD
MSGPNAGKGREIRSYAIGYVLALGLTCLAFAAVRWPTFAADTTLAIVFGLALLQMIVHFRFFLHISLSRSSRDDLQLVLFSALIVALMVSGTLVILFNLRERMM